MEIAVAYRNIGEVYLDMKEENKAIGPIKQYLGTFEYRQCLLRLPRVGYNLA